MAGAPVCDASDCLRNMVRIDESMVVATGRGGTWDGVIDVILIEKGSQFLAANLLFLEISTLYHGPDKNSSIDGLCSLLQDKLGPAKKILGIFDFNIAKFGDIGLKT